MSRTSALFAGATALLLVVVLGSSFAQDRITDLVVDTSWMPSGVLTVAAFFSWDADRLGSSGTGPNVVRLVLFVGLVAVLGGIVGRAGRLSAFVAGWGVCLLAATTAGAVAAMVSDGPLGGGGRGFGLGDRALIGISTAAQAGFALGWLIAVAVAIGARPPTKVAGAAPAVDPGQWGPGPSPAPGPWGEPAGAPAPGPWGSGTAAAPTPPPPAGGAPVPATPTPADATAVGAATPTPGAAGGSPPPAAAGPAIGTPPPRRDPQGSSAPDHPPTAPAGPPGG